MNEKGLRFLALSEIAGGLLLILGIVSSLALAPQFIPPWNVPLATAFALLAISAGTLLLKRDPKGIPLSLLAQTLQAVSIGAGGRFVALAGVRISLVIASTGAALFLDGGGAFHLSTSAPDGSLEALGTLIKLHLGANAQTLNDSTRTIGINFLAIHFAVRLFVRWLAQEDGRKPETKEEASTT